MPLTNYYTKIRSLIHDDLAPGDDFGQIGLSKVFNLTMSTIDESTLAVYVNGVQIHNVSGSHKYSYANGMVTLDSSYNPTSGSAIEFKYQGYEKYTDAELRQYILAAIIRLSTSDYNTFVLREDNEIFPTPVETDENLICFLASILMEGNIQSYKTAEIEIVFDKLESMEKRISKLMANWIKCYGVIDYVKLRWNFIPLDDSYNNLH